VAVVVVTGASSGIGEAAARHLARERGATVVLVARRAERLEQLAAEIGAGASFVAVDLTDDDAGAKIRSHLAERHGGRLDVLVNNAGAAWRERFADGGYEDVRRTMELNFFGPVRLTEALLPSLRESRGAVVNVASVAGRVARPNTGAYSASKAALIAWSDSLRAEEEPNGVHVGTVLPGFIKTEGFPARELLEKRTTRWIVSDVATVAQAIEAAAFEGVRERVAPRPYAVFGMLRLLAPRITFRSVRGGAFTTSTGSSED
jgi:short-subunit dehydrogenase